MKYERLFSPITINGMKLKNRVVMSALHHAYTPDGQCNERFAKYYWRRAEGGAGLIIVGGCRFDEYGGSSPMMSLQTDDFILGYKEFTEGMHERGCKVGVQLYHAGRYSGHKDIPDGKLQLAPSAVYSRFSRSTPKAATQEEIKEVIKKWADAAFRAKEAGFDAIEIVGSAGYLISQFLSTLTNLRTDEYGGPWENRVRFPLEVIKAIREAVGDNYPLMMRIAGNDFVPGSNTNAESVEFCILAEKAGVDVFGVTGGWHETRVPQLHGDLPRGGYVYLASAVKKAVSVPVISSNRITCPNLAEQILALGQSDLIGISRPLLADPDWVKKAYEGREDEIRICVACNQGCTGRAFFGQAVECLVNGYAGREYIYEVKNQKPEKFKNILVVGAGPSGCEFAIRAAEKGHRVTIWEKEAVIGGQLLAASVPPGKQEFKNLAKYLATMLNKNNVRVELNKIAMVENIKEAEFDEIVIATGALSNSLTLLRKSEKIPIYTAVDILQDKYIIGKDIVIVGGGSVGCETAQFLVHKGAAGAEQVYFMMTYQSETVERIKELMFKSERNVTIVETAIIGAGFGPGIGWPVMDDLNRMGVRMYSKSKVVEVGDDYVMIEITGVKENTISTVKIPCDGIVLAAGARPNKALYEELKDAFPNVRLIGDALKVGNVIDAIHAADELALSI